MYIYITQGGQPTVGVRYFFKSANADLFVNTSCADFSGTYLYKRNQEFRAEVQKTILEQTERRLKCQKVLSFMEHRRTGRSLNKVHVACLKSQVRIPIYIISYIGRTYNSRTITFRSLKHSALASICVSRVADRRI